MLSVQLCWVCAKGAVCAEAVCVKAVCVRVCQGARHSDVADLACTGVDGFCGLGRHSGE